MLLYHDEEDTPLSNSLSHLEVILAVVTLRTFALGKLDLLTVLPRET